MTAVALAPGATISGRYHVIRVLGEGGMGQVLEVEHVALGRRFALKVLRVERWSDELVQRFQREARALARVTTPRVAQVTDFGVDPSVGPFYVMELLEGETLESRLAREGRLAPEDAVALAIEIAEALAEVHAAGIVHRDLKPSNVGLPAAGVVRAKLLDFGLAAGVDGQYLERITKSHQVLGSLPYMAPEQFHGAPPSPSIDLYALGVVTFEMLTGKLPFTAPSTAALMHQILSAPTPAPSIAAPGVHPVLDAVVARLLAKDAGARFATAAAAATALREAAASATGGSLPPTRYVPEVQSGSLPPTIAAAAPALRWSSGQVVPPTTTPLAPAPKGPGLGKVLLVVGAAGLLLGGVVTAGIVALLAGGEPERTQSVAGDRAASEAARPAEAPRGVVTGPAPVETPAAPAIPVPTATPDAGIAPEPRATGRRTTRRGAAARNARVREPEPPGPPSVGGGAWTGGIIEEPE